MYEKSTYSYSKKDSEYTDTIRIYNQNLVILRRYQLL